MANKISIEFVAKGNKGVTRAVASLNRQVQELAAANAMLTKGTGNLTVAQKRLVGSLLDTQRSLRNTAKTAGTTGATFSVLRSQMLLASFGAGLFSASILRIANMAGDAAEQTSKAEVVFGSSFDSMTSWADGFGDTVNRSKFQLLGFAAAVQDILVPMGMMRTEAAELSKEIVQTAVDVASFNNTTAEHAMRDFNSALVGNHETVRKFGIVISEARMKQVALDKGIIKAGENLTDQQKILARLAIIQKDSTDAMGDAERTADSYANVMQGLAAQFEETAIVIGQFLMPVIKAFAEVATLILKVLERPTGLLIFTAVLVQLTKNLVIARMTMFGFMRILVRVRQTARLAGLSLKGLGVAFFALEAAFMLYQSIFPEKETEDAIDRAKKLEESIKKVEEAAKKATLAEVKKNIEDFTKITDDGALELDRYKNALDELQKKVDGYITTEVDAIIGVSPQTMAVLAELSRAGETTNIYKRAIESLENVIGPLDEKQKENLATLHEWQKTYNDAVGSTEAFSKAQVKLDKELQKLDQEVKRNAKLLNNESVQGFDAANQAMTRFGLTLENLKIENSDVEQSIHNLIAALDDKQIQNATLALQNQINLFGDLSTAEKTIITLQNKGVALDKEQINTINKLGNEYDELKRSKDAANDIKKAEKTILLLKAQLAAGGKLSELQKFDAELQANLAAGTNKLNILEIQQLREKAAEQDNLNKKLQEQADLKAKDQAEADRKESGAEGLDAQMSANKEITFEIMKQLMNQNLSGKQLEDNIRIELRRKELERQNLDLSAEKIQQIIDEEEKLKKVEQAVTDRVKAEQDAKTEADRRLANLEKEQIQYGKNMLSLQAQSTILEEQLFFGEELSAGEKFRIEMQHTANSLSAQQIEDQAELLDLIEQQTEELRNQELLKQVDVLEQDLKDIRNPQATPEQQFGGDLMAGLPMFASGTDSAFGNFLENSKKAFQDFANQNMADRKTLQAEIDALDDSEVAAKVEKLQKMKELELEYAEFEKDNEEQKAAVRGEALQMAQETFSMFMSARKESLQQDINNELEALKNSHAYRAASDKRKQKMEDDVRKKFAKEQLKLFRFEQLSKLAGIAMNTGEAIMSAVKAFPLTGGMPFTAIIGAMGAAQAGMVLSQKPPKFQVGGLVGGLPHSAGGTLIEAERGEFVMNRQATEAIGLEQLNRMNRRGSIGNNINIHMTGNVLSDDFVADEFIPKLEERIRVLSDGTISDTFA